MTELKLLAFTFKIKIPSALLILMHLNSAVKLKGKDDDEYIPIIVRTENVRQTSRFS